MQLYTSNHSPQDLEMVNKRVRESDLEEVTYLFIDIFHYKLWSAFKDVSKLSKERNTINLSRLRKDSIKHSPPGLSRSPSKRQEWAEVGLLRTLETTWTTENLGNSKSSASSIPTSDVKKTIQILENLVGAKQTEYLKCLGTKNGYNLIHCIVHPTNSPLRLQLAGEQISKSIFGV